ncbi:MAG: DUF885 family protein, partial [Marinomonas sp.]
MRENDTNLTRRQTLAGLGGVSALAMATGCTSPAASADQIQTLAARITPDQQLETIAYDMLKHEPGRATGLGVDTGRFADWRGTFGKVGEDGRESYADTLRVSLERTRAFPKDTLTADQQTCFEVVESAFSSALEGMALPYGDVAVGSWRNAPYLVIQNVGGYIDYPRFFGATQPLRDAQDVEYYLGRLNQVGDVLDGETNRIKQARGMG